MYFTGQVSYIKCLIQKPTQALEAKAGIRQNVLIK